MEIFETSTPPIFNWVVQRTVMGQFMSLKSRLTLLALILFILTIAAAVDSNVIHSLPGFSGILPFKLETGYIGVGENGEHQLFYYFVKSERDPIKDPLVLWLTGGPGCSGFSGLVYEIGPLRFDLSSFDGSLPTFTLNPYSWTKIASIIFIDAPVGTGFSYSNVPESYHMNDTRSAMDNYMFLRKWLLSHPSFIKNRLYVAGDSHGGKIVPMVALHIAEGIEAGLRPQMNLQGYFIGNPLADAEIDSRGKVAFAHRVGLISDDYYELVKSSCNGSYSNPDPNNIRCIYALGLIKMCTEDINNPHILEPKCKFLSPRPENIRWRQNVSEDVTEKFLIPSEQEEPWCRNKNYWSSYVWASDDSVREALHIRKGTKEEWVRCNRSLSYDENVNSVVKYHKLLNERGYQILVYSGDHDFIMPYTGTINWIRSLNLTIENRWRPWIVDGQVAGYTEKYKNGEAYITFATVKGAGHTAPEYKPKECYAMTYRWLSSFPL